MIIILTVLHDMDPPALAADYPLKPSSPVQLQQEEEQEQAQPGQSSRFIK